MKNLSISLFQKQRGFVIADDVVGFIVFIIMMILAVAAIVAAIASSNFDTGSEKKPPPSKFGSINVWIGFGESSFNRPYRCADFANDSYIVKLNNGQQLKLSFNPHVYSSSSFPACITAGNFPNLLPDTYNITNYPSCPPIKVVAGQVANITIAGGCRYGIP